MIVIFGAVAGGRRAAVPTIVASLLVGLYALATSARALGAPPLRLLASSTVTFSSDGGHYVAWEAQGGGRLTVLDTSSWRQTQIALPAGCHLGNDYVDPGATASAASGRFMLSCTPERNSVFDVRSGANTLLSAGASWFELGSRYAQGNSSNEHQVVQSLTTGAVKGVGEPGTVDLDRPGAPGLSAICKRLRPVVRREADAQGSSAYRDDVFVRPLGEHGAVVVRRCRRVVTVLGASRLPQHAYERHKPRYFDLRSRLLTWDTAEQPDGEDAEAGEPLRSRLYAYRLGSGRRESWVLPRFRIKEGPRTLPPVSAGYSVHTADAVFWIATLTTPAGNPDGSVTSAAVYYARL